MAEDARLSTSFPAHPKTRKLRRRLGADGCWCFVVLILWTASDKPDGDLSGLSDEDIEIAADWDGEAGALIKALVELKFMEGDQGSRRIHDWAEHQPFVAGRPARVEQARRAAEARWGKGRDSASSQHADSMPAASDQHAGSMQGASSEHSGACPLPPTTPSNKKPSSSAAPTTPASEEQKPKKPSLAEITDDAITAFNEILGKPNGLLARVTKAGREERQKLVKRCLKTASEICADQQQGDPNITPKFWAAYFAEVDRDPFKSGRQPPGPGHENWKPDFEYLTRPKTMLEVFDGAMSRGSA